MAIKEKEQAVVDLVINGERAKTSLRELSGAYNALNSEVNKLKRADDPKLYDEKIKKLHLVKQARDAERASILSAGQASKNFFSDFKQGFDEIKNIAAGVTIGTLISMGIRTAIGAISNLITGSKQAYAEAVLGQAQLDAAIKSTGNIAGKSVDQLNDMAESLMNLYGIDDDVITKSESLLLTFTNIRGGIYDQALPAIIDMTAAMNGGNVSMETIQATTIQVGKALNDPIKGMTALSKVGVTFSESQKNVIKDLLKTNDVAGAQNIILKELQKEFGGVAKAMADTDVGAAQKFQTRLGNISENIGALLTKSSAWAMRISEPFIAWIESMTDARSEAEKLADSVFDQREEIESLEKTLIPLGDRYDELKSKTKLSKAEQEELNTIIKKIGEQVPIAVTEFDKYGNAISINTGLVKDFIAQQKAMLAITNQDAIADNEAQLRDFTNRKNALIKQLQAGTKQVLIQGEYTSVKMNNDELKAAQKNLELLNQKVLGYQTIVNKLKGESTDAKTSTSTNQPFTIGGPSKAERDKVTAQALKDSQALDKILEDLKLTELRSFAQRLDQYDKEVQALSEKYEKERNMAAREITDKGKLHQALIAIQNAEGKEMQDLIAKQATDAAALKAKADEKKRQDDYKIYQDLTNQQFDAKKGVLSADGLDEELAAPEERRLAIKQEYAEKEYKLELERLTTLKLLAETFGEDSADLDNRIAQNKIKQNEEAARVRYDQDKQYQNASRQIQDAQIAIFSEGASALKGFLNERSFAFKAALIVEKAAAIASIVVNTQREISGYYAANSILGIVGLGISTTQAAIAKVRAGISIGTILAQAIADSFGGNKKKAAKGAFVVPSGPSHAEGGMDLINNRTGERVLEMEGDEPMLILRKDLPKENVAMIKRLAFDNMFANPARVDTTSMSNSIRMASSGAYVSSSTLDKISGQMGSSSSSTRLDKLEMILEAYIDASTREAYKPVNLNPRILEDYNERMVNIRRDVDS